LATHADGRGGVTHDAASGDSPPLFLADNAAFGFALVRLYGATRKPACRDAAARIAGFLVKELPDPASRGFHASTPDHNAVGVFAARRKPFEDNAMAVRFLARMARVAPEAGAEAYRAAIARAVRGVFTREAILGRGRFLGDLLLAMDEAREFL